MNIRLPALAGALAPALAPALVLALALALPAAAQAKTALTGSTPAAGASVKRTEQINLSFDAPLAANTAGAELVMTAMPGMANHSPMAIKAFTISLSADGRTLTMTLKKPLPAGSYTLRFSAYDTARERVSGTLDFTVG